MILIPGNQVTYREADKDFDRLNHFKVEEAGEKVAILALGDFYQRGEQLSAKIKAELGWQPQHSTVEEIIKSAWKWHQSHPYGYNG